MTRTRFAPSPTGYLHIGGVRSALFNWLFAKKHQGQFILRIDDTDAERNVEEALQPILHGFRWLGLNWDEGPDVGGPHQPYYQSQRLQRYQQAVQQLLDKGLAYRDYATPEEVKAERDAAEKEKRQFVYSRTWMADTPEKQAAFEAEGRQGVVRLLMPREGKLVLNDLIRGQVEFDWAREQDHVIQRANGTCLYHLANVVDDFDFQITHVIRAEEHLSNTARQVFIVDGLGYPRPAYAHLPFVAEPGSKTKLSKRKIPQYLKNKGFAGVYEHGCQIARAMKLEISEDTFNPVIVDFYEQVGYLPAAILNFLLLLGWSLDDKTEFFSVPEMIDHFSLERVVKAPASFDPDKLMAFQSHYMNQLSTEQKLEMMLPYLLKAGLISNSDDQAVREKVTRIINACGDRLKVAGDIILMADIIFVHDDDLQYDAVAATKTFAKHNAISILFEFKRRFENLEEREFTPENIRIQFHQHYDLIARVTTNKNDRQMVHSQIDRLAGDTYIAELQSDITPDQIDQEEFKQLQKIANIKPSDMVQPVRMAITGRTVGFGLYDTMAILGKNACIARIDRAIEEFKSTTNSIAEELFKDVPNCISDQRVPAKLEDGATLYEGSFVLSVDHNTYNVDGRIYYDFFPSPMIKFNGSKEDGFDLLRPLFQTSKNINISVEALSWRAEGICTNYNLKHNKGLVEGAIVDAPPIIKSNVLLSSLKFWVANFFIPLGMPITDGNSGWLGRQIASNSEWEIIIDSRPKERLQKKNAFQNGYAISHVGIIKPINSTDTTIEEYLSLIDTMQDMMSFAKGYWVAPFRLEGFNKQNESVWESWSLQKFDRFKVVSSWYPTNPSTFQDYASKYLHFCSDESSREILHSVLYWYLTSNYLSNAVDLGVVAANCSIELLSEFVCSKNRNIKSDAYSKWSFSQKCTALLEEFDIPTEFNFLNCDGPGFLQETRNNIVHPRLNVLNKINKSRDFSHNFLAWNLALSYIELSILKLIGYTGPYVKRNFGDDGSYCHTQLPSTGTW